MAKHENWDYNNNYGFVEINLDQIDPSRLEQGEPYTKNGKEIRHTILRLDFSACNNPNMQKKQTHDLKIALNDDERAKLKAHNLANPDDKKYAGFVGGITQLKGNDNWVENRTAVKEGTKMNDIIGTNAAPSINI